MAKTIEDYKKDYAAARSAGDAAGMKAANDGANAIRALQGQAAQVADEDIARVAAGASNTGTSVKSSGSSGGYSKYTGGNDELDTAIAQYSKLYADARAKGDAVGMRNANDAANQLRNQYGYAAERADEDIAKTAARSAAAEQNTAPGNDLSDYLEEMYAAQKKSALAQLDSAYQQNLNALERAGTGLDTQYQTARNQAAGASELAARNFREYAAAAGLNSGTGGQAELARNIALQNDLSTLSTQEASTLADLELQRAQAETEYNTAIAQAEAQGNYELAAALYQEKVRQNEESLQQQMLAYEAQRDAVADQQWQQSFDRQTASQLADYGTAFLTQGIMPSSEMLSAMGMSSEDAQRYINSLGLLTAAGSGSLTAASGGGSAAPAEDGDVTWGEGYSTQRNNGMKASEWDMVKNNIAVNLREGNYDNVNAYMSQVSGKMSREQYNEIVDLLTRYGYTGLRKY